MATYLDARVPVVFASLEDAGPLDAILVEGEAFHAAAHVPGCPCCPPRGAAGRALAALLQDRARGRIPFFTRVISISATESRPGGDRGGVAVGPSGLGMFQAGVIRAGCDAGTSRSPTPSGRCMITTSSHLPNFTPHARITPAR